VLDSTDDGSDLTIDGVKKDGCFSGSTIVQVQGKGDVAMADLKLGDKVLTDKNTFQPVYSFGHRKPDVETDFVQIYTNEAEDPLEMTGNHMVMAYNIAGRLQATRADSIQVGSHLLHAQKDEPMLVTMVKTTKKKGLYMPLTPNGKIVVNDVVASNYISISDKAPGVVGHSSWFFAFLSMPEQTLSHWWMSPFRMLCMGVSSGYCSNGDELLTAHKEDEQESGILPWLLTGRALAEVVELQPNLVQIFVFGVPAFIIFGFFNLVETVFLGPSFAPALMMVLAAALITKYYKAKKDAGEKEEEKENDLKKKLLVENV